MNLRATQKHFFERQATSLGVSWYKRVQSVELNSSSSEGSCVTSKRSM